jgi:hypothetical protein
MRKTPALLTTPVCLPVFTSGRGHSHQVLRPTGLLRFPHELVDHAVFDDGGNLWGVKKRNALSSFGRQDRFDSCMDLGTHAAHLRRRNPEMCLKHRTHVLLVLEPGALRHNSER